MTAKPASEQTELSEDMELVGPGQMLADARKAMKLSVEQVAERLNFTLTMVKNIEAEQFDDKLPKTFTRGYLRNYAKLVELDQNDVLASYEMLGVAQIQRSEMQSFSKSMKKRAENNRLMWISYFIAALLVGSTIFWWWQLPTPKLNQNVSNTNTASLIQNKPEQTIATQAKTGTQENNADQQPLADELATQSNDVTEQTINSSEIAVPELSANLPSNLVAEQPTSLDKTSAIAQQIKPINEAKTSSAEPLSSIDKVEFYFAGDCWVNIYDATGERIAWGIKKSGYTMRIQGKAPFKVTLGKPELVTIKFNQQAVDLSSFGKGNIAKFELPLTSNE